MDGKKIDFLDPLTIIFFIAAWISDLAFLGMIGLAIPVVGIAIAAGILIMHYAVGLLLLAVFWGKTSGWMPKLILLISWLLPLPALGGGIAWAILTSNKLVAFLVETVAIQAVALATGSLGEVLEIGAVAAEGADVAVTAAEGVEAAAEVAEAGETVAQGAQVGAEAGASAAETAETAEAAGSSAESIDEMAAQEEGNPMENLQDELEEPQDESNATKRTRKVFDIADRTNSQQQDEEEDDDQQMAA